MVAADLFERRGLLRVGPGCGYGAANRTVVCQQVDHCELRQLRHRQPDESAERLLEVEGYVEHQAGVRQERETLLKPLVLTAPLTPLATVAHEAGEQRWLDVGHTGHRQFDRELAAVLVQSCQLESAVEDRWITRLEV